MYNTGHARHETASAKSRPKMTPRQLRFILLSAMAAATLLALSGENLGGDDMRLIARTRGIGWNLAAHFGDVLEVTHYSPVASLIFRFEDAVFADNHILYYMVNCLIHLAAGWFVGLIAERLEGPIAGTFAAVAYFGLFAHYETSAWISAANYGGAAALFTAAGAYFYLCSDGRNRGALLVSTLSLWLALSSKEEALAFVPVVASLTIARREPARFTKPLLAFWTASSIILLCYVTLSWYRFRYGWYSENRVVVLTPGIHYLRNLLEYPGSLFLSLFAPSFTFPVVSLSIAGGIGLTAWLVLAPTASTLSRWGLLWVLAGCAPLLFFTIPWQSRYAVIPAAGFALGIASWTTTRKRRVALSIMIAVSFLCRLEAHWRYHRFQDRVLELLEGTSRTSLIQERLVADDAVVTGK